MFRRFFRFLRDSTVSIEAQLDRRADAPPTTNVILIAAVRLSQKVGGSIHTEYWIPAEDLAEFNGNIRGLIVVISEFR
jgi:hypothetical protein